MKNKLLDFKDPFQSLDKETLYLLIFLLLIIFISYIIPTILFLSPSGTDVYTHMYNTLRMVDSKSLFEFYEKSFREEYLGYDYPFGLWLFGSIVMKVTGIDIHTIAYALPLILMMISILLYYIYANNFLQAKNKAILSVIFLISMPLILMGILNYSTSRFVSIFLIAIIFLIINKLNFRNLIISSILIFSLVFSHVGTYLFLMFFLISYFILSALIWRQFDTSVYVSIVSLLVLYVFAANLFPFVQPHYIDKGRLVLSIAESISSHLNLGFVDEMGRIFYDKIFVSNNLIYAVFWSCFIFAIGKLALYINSKYRFIGRGKLITIPIIRNISHGIEATPIWLGPLHVLLSLFGVSRLNYKAKCMGLSLVLVAIYPGALQPAEGTGALREIYYLYLIVPITSAAGFYYIISKLSNYCYCNKRRKAIFNGFILLSFLILVCTPIIGNVYYQPIITGTKAERENLFWLSKIGNPWEGASGFAYRERIDLYANKVTPSIPSGSEMKRYLNDLKNIYFSIGGEEYAKDLYSFNIKYIISSDRTLKGSGESKDSLKIDFNKQLDKIYSSTSQNFSIYKFIVSPNVLKEPRFNEFKIEFEENTPKIQDYGSIYLIENNFYKVKLSTTAPQIEYIGTKTRNFLGEGEFYDFIKVFWRGVNSYKERYVGYSLNELNYSISVKDNKIIYKTVVRDENNTENWATLIVKYIFYEKTIKREIIIANDWVNLDSDLSMNLWISNFIFAPITDFKFNQIGYGEEKVVIRKIYPSQDAVILKDKKFNEIYFNGSGTGLFIKYSDLSPYPSRISYRGSTIYEYGGISIDSNFYLSAGESISVIQFLSVGDEFTAKSNVEQYTSVSPYFYSEAKIPAILTGYIDEHQEHLLNVYKKFQEYNVTYSAAITFETQNLIPKGVNSIGYASSYGKNAYKNLSVQNEEIKKVKEALNIRGVLFKYFKYNLDTIKVLSNNNILFAKALTVPSPFFEFFREGLRHPKIAYHQGEETGVVLIPITLPTSSLLRPEYDVENVFSQWKETLDSVVEEGGMAVFLWNVKDIDSPDYFDKILELINYSKSRGLNFTTPDDVAAHFKLLQNISVKIRKGVDYAIFNASNYNQEDAMGVTYKLNLPVLNNSCPYHAINGRISKQIVKGQSCVVYVSFDLKANENKEIIVEPNISRKLFKLDLSNIYEGDSYILIRDQEGNPVHKAIVYVDAQRFESNHKGEIQLNIRRGVHRINVEKPGFVPEYCEIEVKGKIYKIISSFSFFK